MSMIRYGALRALILYVDAGLSLCAGLQTEKDALVRESVLRAIYRILEAASVFFCEEGTLHRSSIGKYSPWVFDPGDSALVKTQSYLKTIRNEIEVVGDSFPAGMTRGCVVIYLTAQTLMAEIDDLANDEMNRKDTG